MFFGLIIGWFTAGVLYAAAVWFHPWWWIGRGAARRRFRCRIAVRPKGAVQLWTASAGPVADKDQELVAAAEQEMLGAVTQWAVTRPLAGYSVAILMTPQGMIHIWTELQGIFVPGDRKWTYEERTLLPRPPERPHLRRPRREPARRRRGSAGKRPARRTGLVGLPLPPERVKSVIGKHERIAKWSVPVNSPSWQRRVLPSACCWPSPHGL